MSRYTPDRTKAFETLKRLAHNAQERGDWNECNDLITAMGAMKQAGGISENRQPWEELTDHELKDADDIARRIVVNVTGIDDLIDRWMHHGYRPTIDLDEGEEHQKLADYYDRRAAQRGITTTAYRLQRRRP